jgi:hypothetical protein
MSVSIDTAIAALREANPFPEEALPRSMAEAAVFLESRELHRHMHTLDSTASEAKASAVPAGPVPKVEWRSREMTELKFKRLATFLSSGSPRLIAGIAAAAIVIAVWVLIRPQHNAAMAGLVTPSPPTTVLSSLQVSDHLIDLSTGEMTPLPEAILGSLDPEMSFGPPARGRYAALPDGSELAYIGDGTDGSLEMFVAGIDGSGVHQVTNHTTDVISPAWSPDGTLIAYQASEGLFVLDVATGESTQVLDLPGASGPQFKPDGLSLLYTFPSSGDDHQLSIVPLDGGSSTVLIGRQQGMGAAGFGSLSPDGSLVIMLGHEINGPGAGLFLAKTDGSKPRSMGLHSGNCRSYPSGAWSPDGSRIVCSGDSRDVLVVNVTTGQANRVAKGIGAIWLDNHTLLVEARE